jgi:hypothetical protein
MNLRQNIYWTGAAVSVSTHWFPNPVGGPVNTVIRRYSLLEDNNGSRKGKMALDKLALIVLIYLLKPVEAGLANNRIRRRP